MKILKFWPLGLSIALSIFISLLIIFVLYSHYHRVDLVNADYYEQGNVYQQQIDRINLGQQNVYRLLVEYNRRDRVLKVNFPKDLEPRSISGTILMFRPADAGQDQKVPLMVGSNHQQTIDVHTMSNGLWRIKISWQKNELRFYYEEKIIID